jgi:hypothetical protein
MAFQIRATAVARFKDRKTAVTPGRVFQISVNRVAGQAAARPARPASEVNDSAPAADSASCFVAWAVMFLVSFSMLKHFMLVLFCAGLPRQHIHRSGRKHKQVNSAAPAKKSE